MLRRRSPLPNLHHGLIGLGLILGSCAAPRTRAVLDTDPRVTRVEIVRQSKSAAMSTAGSVEDGAEKPPVRAHALDLRAILESATKEREAHFGAVEPFAKMIGNEGPTQLDPEQGPIDLGLRVNINFGASEAPYDDAMQPIHGVVSGRSGFSDSVLQLSWRERMGATYGIHGTAAIARFQDEAIIEGLSNSEFAWFVLGIHASF